VSFTVRIAIRNHAVQIMVVISSRGFSQRFDVFGGARIDLAQFPILLEIEP